MKKVLFFTLVPIALILGSIIFAIWVSYGYVQYQNDTYFHVMGAMEDERAVAEYNGTTTMISGGNLRKINNLLTPSELKRRFVHPDFNEDECIRLSFPDGAEYLVMRNEDTEDGVHIRYTYQKKKQYYRVEGYKTFEWLQKAISPEGIYGENEPAENG